MKVIVGADDEGPVLTAVVTSLQARGADVELLPTMPWPTVARRVGQEVASGAFDFGVLMCWTGTGTSMMANKIKGVRAALCWDPWIAEGARRWNDANVLVMSLKRNEPVTAVEILDSWLSVEGPDEDELENISMLDLPYPDGP